MVAKKVNWVGCQGSEPHFRGFPCSLWILFHFLTVQAARHNLDHSQETGESEACVPAWPCPALHRLPAAGPDVAESALAADPGALRTEWGGPGEATQSWPRPQRGALGELRGIRFLSGFLGATSLLCLQNFVKNLCFYFLYSCQGKNSVSVYVADTVCFEQFYCFPRKNHSFFSFSPPPFF